MKHALRLAVTVFAWWFVIIEPMGFTPPEFPFRRQNPVFTIARPVGPFETEAACDDMRQVVEVFTSLPRVSIGVCRQFPLGSAD